VGDVESPPDEVGAEVGAFWETGAGDVCPAGAELFPAIKNQTIAAMMTTRTITHTPIFDVLDMIMMIFFRPFGLPFNYTMAKSGTKTTQEKRPAVL
jgi:hypothetical protein